MKVDSYTAKGTKGKPVTLPKELADKGSDHLLAQALRVYTNRSHPGLSKVKTRSEVVGSRKKIWRQKGTGRARHGARSAPIFVGGGKAHGPRGIKRILTLPKNMRRKALSSAFAERIHDKKVIVVSGLSGISKTKEANALLTKVAPDAKKITVALSVKNKEKRLMFRNIENVKVHPFTDLNAFIVYHSGVLVLDSDALNESSKEDKK